MSDLTHILNGIEHGAAKAADELFPLVDEELRKLAARTMGNEAPEQKLQSASVVAGQSFEMLAAGKIV